MNNIYFPILLLVATLSLSTILAPSANALEIQLFDSANFSGPYLIARGDEGCTNLTAGDAFIQEARSLKTDTCIMIFKGLSCASYSIRLDPGEYPDLTVVKHETTNFMNPLSYRPCTSGEGGSAVNVDIYGYAMIIGDENSTHNGLLLRYRDVCDCINLQTKSPYIANVTRVRNFGNCIKIFSEKNCEGTSIELLGGLSPQSETIPSTTSFIIPSTSINLCEPRLTCHVLNIEVNRFVLISNETSGSAKNYTSDIAITTKTTLRNNGNATMTQVYEANKRIKDSVEVTRISSFGSISSRFSTSRHVSYEYKGGWFWSTEMITNTLPKAYQSSTLGEANGEKFTSEEEREIGVRQQIELPPCSEYEVDSYVTVAQNLPVEYEFYANVSGMARDKRLTTDELKERLTDGLEYVSDVDDYTIEVKGTGKILADLSLEATIDGIGSPILNCPSTIVTHGDDYGKPEYGRFSRKFYQSI